MSLENNSVLDLFKYESGIVGGSGLFATGRCKLVTEFFRWLATPNVSLP